MRAAGSRFPRRGNVSLQVGVSFRRQRRSGSRISNAILIAIQFVTGYWWARYTLSKPWLVGLGLLVGEIVLVAVAILLGG